jgi:hypothetical protein
MQYSLDAYGGRLCSLLFVTVEDLGGTAFASGTGHLVSYSCLGKSRDEIACMNTKISPYFQCGVNQVDAREILHPYHIGALSVMLT